jgi:hypothetical protein
MPAVVKTWLESQDWNSTQEVQQILVASFRADFYKYASAATVEHLKKIFDSVPRLLGKKFKFSEVTQEIKSRELSKALHLLEEAGIVYRCYHSSGNGVPLSGEENSAKFKVFFLDVGLVNRILGVRLSQLFLERKMGQTGLGILFSHRGALAEQFVAQELLSLTAKNETPRLHYWHREAKSSLAEVDFLFECGNRIIPIEVKSGDSGRARSLQRFIQEKKPPTAVRVSAANYSQNEVDGTVLQNFPFYKVSEILT